MLAIRMQRLGRKGHPTYQVVVQDSRWAPTSGKVVARLGSYNPHTKATTLIKEKAELYLSNGAQPSERVVKLLSGEGVKLPKWVKQPTKQSREIRHTDKLRRNRPPEEKVAEEPPVTPSADESSEVSTQDEAPAAAKALTDKTEDTPAEPEAPVAEVEAESEESAPEEASEPVEDPETKA